MDAQASSLFSPPPKLHALVLPFPSQGHINPLLLFSAHLALHGSTVTFVNTEASQQRMLHSQTVGTASPLTDVTHPQIRFVTIPDGLRQNFNLNGPTSAPITPPSLECVKQQKEALEEIIESSMDTASPISCIVSDSFFPWTLDVANKFGIPRALFWTGNATTFYLNVLVATGIHKLGGPWKDTPESPLHPGLSYLHTDAIDDFSLDNSPERLRFVMERFQRIQENACILINSFYELEGALVGATPLDVPIRCIGPLLPPGDAKIAVRGSLHREEENCLQWLDKQATSSVLYISFGSIAALTPDQLTELALGIEASGQAFLWVIRAEAGDKAELLPQGFVERTENQGMIISWAPQVRVLSHRAVGGFLTHCGWNSTVESIATGVPMLCWPVFAEQPLNSRLIVKQWKVGLQFERRKGESPLVGRVEVERMVTEVMVGEKDGRMVRQRVAELSAAARVAIGKSGSSWSSHVAFVRETCT